MNTYENNCNLNDCLKISSDFTPFFKYSFYPMVTLSFVYFAVLSFTNRQVLIGLVLIQNVTAVGGFY